jgi:hypothetical protein
LIAAKTGKIDHGEPIPPKGTYKYFRDVEKPPYEGDSPHDYKGMSAAVVSNQMCIARSGTGRSGSNGIPFKRDEDDRWIADKLALYKKVHGWELKLETYIPFHFARGIVAKELDIPMNWSKFASIRWGEWEARKVTLRMSKSKTKQRKGGRRGRLTAGAPPGGMTRGEIDRVGTTAVEPSEMRVIPQNMDTETPNAETAKNDFFVAYGRRTEEQWERIRVTRRKRSTMSSADGQCAVEEEVRVPHRMLTRSSRKELRSEISAHAVLRRQSGRNDSTRGGVREPLCIGTTGIGVPGASTTGRGGATERGLPLRHSYVAPS